MADTAAKTEQTQSKAKDANLKADKGQAPELGYEEEIAPTETKLSKPLEQIAAQQREQGVQSAVVIGLIAGLTDKDYVATLKDQALQRQLEELAAAYEQRKKERKTLDAREPVIFEKLASILGKPLVDKFGEAISRAVKSDSITPTSNYVATKAAVAEILVTLKSDERCRALGISSAPIEKAINDRLAELQKISSTLIAIPANRPDPGVIGAKLTESVRANPEGALAYLMTKEGTELLRARLAAEPSSEARVSALRSLKEIVGPERLSALLDAVDAHLHVPLVALCVEMSGATPVEQRKTLELLLDRNQTLLTNAQRERLGSYLVGDTAVILEALRIEHERIPDQISALERQRVENYRHLARELSIEAPSGVSVDDSQRAIMSAVLKSFPQLADKSWSEVYKALSELSGKADLEEFRTLAGKMGLRLIPQALTQDEYARLTEDQRGQAYIKRQADILKEMGDVKQLSVRLFTLMREVELNEQRLIELRAMRVDGPDQESARVLEKLTLLYGGVVPEFSRERIEAQRKASGIYLETLHGRIDAEHDPVVLQRLCAERDSIEWRALIARATALSVQNPPKNERVNAILMEFFSAHGEGMRGRRPEFVAAADSITQALHATRGYFHDAQIFYSKELNRVEGEIARLEGEAIPKLKSAVDAKKAEVDSYHTVWGLRQPQPYLDAKRQLETLIAQKDAAEAELKKHEERSKIIQDALKKVDGSQTHALGQVILGGQRNLGVAGMDAIKVTCDLGKERESEVVSLAKQLQLLSETRNSALQQVARVDLIGRASCANSDFATSVSSSAARLHQIIKADRSMNPEPAALEALRGLVSADSALGKALAEVLKSSRSPREKLDLLFARLSVEEVMRIKAFLLSYDRPELFEQVGREKLADARAVWTLLSGLQENDKAHNLSELLYALPSIRTLADASAVLAQLSEADRAAVLKEYERVSSRSLTQSVLLHAPVAMPARGQFLLALCTSSFVTEADLKPFFPEGKVPQEPGERQQVLLEAFQRDGTVDAKLPSDFEKLVSTQAAERARLQIALPTMMHLNRVEDVRSIRRRLAELDSQFNRPLVAALGRFSEDYLARSGLRHHIEASRDLSTQVTSMEVVDPYGEVAREARQLAHIVEGQNFSADDVIGYIRRENPTPERMMVLEVMYWQHVTSRPSLGLTGDLRIDALAKRGADSLSLERVGKLLRGVKDALDAYDIEKLTEGLRTKNPQLAIRAMLAIGAKENGAAALQALIEKSPEIKKLWDEYLKQPAVGAAQWTAKEAQHLYTAIVTNDQAKIAVVKLVNGAGWVADKGGDLVSSLYDQREVLYKLGADGVRQATKAGEEIYGSDFAQALGRYGADAKRLASVKWGEFLSSDVVAQAKAGTAMALSVLKMPELDINALARVVSSIPLEYRQQALEELEKCIAGLPDSAMYRDGNGKVSLVAFVRSKGGALGEADAEVFGKLLPSADGRALSPEALRRYSSERERLSLQLREISELKGGRQVILEGARDFFPTIVNLHNAAKRDEQGRIFSQGRAAQVTGAHATMLNDQRKLLQHLHSGMEDIRATNEVMRVRSVGILEDILREENRGLHSEQSERDLGELRQRDIAREWVSVRREVFKRWQHEAETTQKALANLDWWLEVGYSALKVAVFVGLSMTGVGTLALLGVATAWNALDKTYRVMARGMDTREAFRQFAIEFAIDAACAGAFSAAARLPRLKVWTPFVKRTADIERGGIKAAASKVQVRLSTPKAAVAGALDVKGGTRKLVERALGKFNSAVGDPLLYAKHVAVTAERLKMRLPWQSLFAPGALSFKFPKSEQGPAATPKVPTGPAPQTPPLPPQQHQPIIPPVIPSVVVDTTKPTTVGTARLAAEDVEQIKVDVEKLVTDIKDGKISVRELQTYLEQLFLRAGIEPAGDGKTLLDRLLEGAKSGDQQAKEVLATLQPIRTSLEAMYENRDRLVEGVYKDNMQNYFVALDGLLGFMNPGWKVLWTPSNPPQLPPAPPMNPPPQPPAQGSGQRPGGGDSGSGGSGGPGLSPTIEPGTGNSYTRAVLSAPEQAKVKFEADVAQLKKDLAESTKQLDSAKQANADKATDAQKAKDAVANNLKALGAAHDNFLGLLAKNAVEAANLTGVSDADKQKHAEELAGARTVADQVRKDILDGQEKLKQADDAQAAGVTQAGRNDGNTDSKKEKDAQVNRNTDAQGINVTQLVDVVTKRMNDALVGVKKDVEPIVASVATLHVKAQALLDELEKKADQQAVRRAEELKTLFKDTIKTAADKGESVKEATLQVLGKIGQALEKAQEELQKEADKQRAEETAKQIAKIKQDYEDVRSLVEARFSRIKADITGALEKGREYVAKLAEDARVAAENRQREEELRQQVAQFRKLFDDVKEGAQKKTEELKTFAEVVIDRTKVVLAEQAERVRIESERKQAEEARQRAEEAQHEQRKRQVEAFTQAVSKGISQITNAVEALAPLSRSPIAADPTTGTPPGSGNGSSPSAAQPPKDPGSSNPPGEPYHKSSLPAAPATPPTPEPQLVGPLKSVDPSAGMTQQPVPPAQTASPEPASITVTPSVPPAAPSQAPGTPPSAPPPSPSVAPSDAGSPASATGIKASGQQKPDATADRSTPGSASSTLIPQAIQTFAPGNPPSTPPFAPSLAPSSPGTPPSAPSMAPSSPGIPPSAPSMAPSSPGIPPSAPSVAPSFPGAPPSAPSMAPSAPGTPPSATGIEASGQRKSDAVISVPPQVSLSTLIPQPTSILPTTGTIALEELFARGASTRPPSFLPPTPPPPQISRSQQPPLFEQPPSRTFTRLDESEPRAMVIQPVTTHSTWAAPPTMKISTPVTSSEAFHQPGTSASGTAPVNLSSSSPVRPAEPLSGPFNAPSMSQPSVALQQGVEAPSSTVKSPVTQQVTESVRSWGAAPTIKPEPVVTVPSSAPAAQSVERVQGPDHASTPPSTPPPPTFSASRPPPPAPPPSPPSYEARATEVPSSVTPDAPRLVPSTAPTMKVNPDRTIQSYNEGEKPAVSVTASAHVSESRAPSISVSSSPSNPPPSFATSESFGSPSYPTDSGALPPPAPSESQVPRSSETSSSDVQNEQANRSRSKAQAIKKRKKLQSDEQERLRKMIMHQLLTQSFEKAKREKLLRMLASLGLTEQEYRAFLARLKTAEVTRHEAATIEKVEKVAVVVESFAKPAAPTIKKESAQTLASQARPKNRAELYAQFKKSSSLP